MIEVTVDIVPFGLEERRKLIGKIKIANIYMRPNDMADYGFSLYNESGEITTTGGVKEHQRSLGVWKLLLKVLNQL